MIVNINDRFLSLGRAVIFGYIDSHRFIRNHENEKDPVRSNKHRAVQVTDESL